MTGYYLVHAEGRKYGTKGQGRGHGLNVGLSLHHRSVIVAAILHTIPNILKPDEAFESDFKTPGGQNVPAILRAHDYFLKKPSKTASAMTREQKRLATLAAVRQAISNTGCDGLDIAIAYKNDLFYEETVKFIRELLPSAEDGDAPFLRIHRVPPSPTLFDPLDSGELKQADFYSLSRSPDFRSKWDQKMDQSRVERCKDWKKYLTSIDWRPGIRRMILIESLYKEQTFKGAPPSQHIKSAIRDACCQVGVTSQFLATLKRNKDGELGRGVDSRLKNAVLDLVLRQTGAVYGQPSELWQLVAKDAGDVSIELDTVVFSLVSANWWRAKGR